MVTTLTNVFLDKIKIGKIDKVKKKQEEEAKWWKKEEKKQ